MSVCESIPTIYMANSVMSQESLKRSLSQLAN